MFRYVCEACGTVEVLTAQKAFEDGWDYPPFIGTYGVLGPRTCGKCPVTATLWWRIMTGQTQVAMSLTDLAIIKRVEGEPGSLSP